MLLGNYIVNIIFFNGIVVIVVVFLSLSILLVVDVAQTSEAVNNANTQLIGTGNNFLSLLGSDSVVDDGSVFSVLHHEGVELAEVVDDNALESLGIQEFGFFVASVSNTWHWARSLVITPHWVIDTSGSSPVWLIIIITGREREMRKNLEKKIFKIENVIGCWFFFSSGKRANENSREHIKLWEILGAERCIVCLFIYLFN